MLYLVAVVGLAAQPPGTLLVEQDGVSLQTKIRASMYEWTVINRSGDPIVRFEIDRYHGYDYHVPEGWEQETPMPEDAFRAWTNNKSKALGRGRAGTFSFRAGSRGAFVGLVDARIGFESGRSITVERVWGTVPESRSAILVVVGTLVLIILGHALILAYTNRRRTGSKPTGSQATAA